MLNKVASGGCHRFLGEFIEQAWVKIWAQIRRGVFDRREKRTQWNTKVFLISLYQLGSSLPVSKKLVHLE